MQEKWWLDKHELLLKSTAGDYRSATWDKARLFINMDEAKVLYACCMLFVSLIWMYTDDDNDK
jgi:hypothetical protein